VTGLTRLGRVAERADHHLADRVGAASAGIDRT
jgi:hypothetical protein